MLCLTRKKSAAEIASRPRFSSGCSVSVSLSSDSVRRTVSFDCDEVEEISDNDFGGDHPDLKFSLLLSKA